MPIRFVAASLRVRYSLHLHSACSLKVNLTPSAVHNAACEHNMGINNALALNRPPSGSETAQLHMGLWQTAGGEGYILTCNHRSDNEESQELESVQDVMRTFPLLEPWMRRTRIQRPAAHVCNEPANAPAI